MNPTIEKELHGYLETLSEPQQRRVVEYARSMATAVNASPSPTGVSGAELLASLSVRPLLSNEEAAQMLRDIEEGCEQVEDSTWERATFAE